MYNVDIDKFWKDDALARKENCFFEGAPQVALGLRMSDECVFAELGENGNPWGETPLERRIELNKRYNEKAVKTVGIKLLQEEFPSPDANFPATKQIGEIFGGYYFFRGSWWLKSDITTPKELEKALDIADKTDIREFLLPENWESEKTRIFEKYGKKPPRARHIRGPVTLAASIFGAENLIFLILDEPDLAKRFSAAIADAAIKIAEVMDEEAGFTKDNAPPGFSFADDNCCLLTDEMYELFGYPVLDKVFKRFCPNKEDFRYQHSDSAMEHLLPILAKVNLTGCNFGPTVLVDKIRKYMKNTRIDGCLAPFTLMNNNKSDIIAEVKRDCEMIKASQTKGLNLSAAGSVNDGSLLESMLVVMYAVQTYGRF